jgi:hypothetical protein
MIIYNFLSNQILAFPRPIGLREGTLKAYPKIKNLLINKRLIRYKAIDYTHLMISPEELFPGCIIDCATPSVAIFLRNTSDSPKITIDKVDEFYLTKLLKIFSYSSELNPKKHDEKIQALAKNIVEAYIVSFDIELTKINNLIEVIDIFLENQSAEINT